LKKDSQSKPVKLTGKVEDPNPGPWNPSKLQHLTDKGHEQYLRDKYGRSRLTKNHPMRVPMDLLVQLRKDLRSIDDVKSVVEGSVIKLDVQKARDDILSEIDKAESEIDQYTMAASKSMDYQAIKGLMQIKEIAEKDDFIYRYDQNDKIRSGNAWFLAVEDGPHGQLLKSGKFSIKDESKLPTIDEIIEILGPEKYTKKQGQKLVRDKSKVQMLRNHLNELGLPTRRGRDGPKFSK